MLASWPIVFIVCDIHVKSTVREQEMYWPLHVLFMLMFICIVYLLKITLHPDIHFSNQGLA